ncbi:MAG: hypothetical protein LUH02_06385 [Erysipelotrichaceae bacterium]|nr:hypothetical protein [Erysipelotrichaceae bacterium]
MTYFGIKSKDEIYNTKQEGEILKKTDYVDVVILTLGLIKEFTPFHNDSNAMYGFIDEKGNEHWASKKTIYKALTDLVQIQENVEEKNKEIKIESKDDRDINKQLNSIYQKLDTIDRKMTNKNTTQLDQIKYDISNIKQRVDSLVYNYRNNHVKVQDDKKINDLQKQVDNYNDDMKKELRDLRDSIEIQANNINDCYREVRSLPGHFTILSNKIDNIDITSVMTKEENDDELEITNPDAKLLAEMYETSQKLNEMIYRVAMSMALNNENHDEEKNEEDNDIKIQNDE